MRPPLFILDRGETFVVRGHAWALLTGAGIKPYYCGGSAMGFVVDGHRLRDLCAYLDNRRIPYRIKRGDVEPPAPNRVHHHEVDRVHHRDGTGHLDGAQLDLFGGGDAA